MIKLFGSKQINNEVDKALVGVRFLSWTTYSIDLVLQEKLQSPSETQ